MQAFEHACSAAHAAYTAQHVPFLLSLFFLLFFLFILFSFSIHFRLVYFLISNPPFLLLFILVFHFFLILFLFYFRSIHIFFHVKLLVRLWNDFDIFDLFYYFCIIKLFIRIHDVDISLLHIN